MTEDTASQRFRSQPDLRAEAARRRRLQRDLAAAISQQALVLHLQPRLCLSSGRRTGLEALLRWPHPRRGLLPDTTLLPLAEQAGLAASLGGWALEAACREAARWVEPCTVSVAVSPRQIAEGVVLRQVAAALDASGLDPERLELGLTEASLPAIDADALLTLSAVRDLGVGLVLDEFGTGLAGIAMLKRLPLTAMRIDRSLVRDLPADREDAAILRAVVEAGHAIGLTVVATGVETEAQRGFLAGCGCHEGQGHLFGRPAPAASFVAGNPSAA